jgi:hypothetical protein
MGVLLGLLGTGSPWAMAAIVACAGTAGLLLHLSLRR